MVACVQLAKKVCYRNGLHVKTVHPVELLPVEMFHLKLRDYTIIVQVAAPEPKLNAGVRSFVLFG